MKHYKLYPNYTKIKVADLRLDSKHEQYAISKINSWCQDIIDTDKAESDVVKDYEIIRETDKFGHVIYSVVKFVPDFAIKEL